MALEYNPEVVLVTSIFKEYRNSIDIYTEDSHVSYSACGLPYYIQGNFERRIYYGI